MGMLGWENCPNKMLLINTVSRGAGLNYIIGSMIGLVILVP